MSTLHEIATKIVAAWDAGDKQHLRLLMELLRHALEQQGEPVAWYSDDWKIICRADERVFWKSVAKNPLYAGAAPAAQPMQGDLVSYAERLSNALIDQPESLHVRVAASTELSLLSKKAEQLLKHQPDARKVIEQMVDALGLVASTYGAETPMWAQCQAAIQAGNDWLKEYK